MNKFKWLFMSGRKKLLYQIECAKANGQKLYLSKGIVLDFTEDTENLLKERAGLKLHCAEYKRKYKAFKRILIREVCYRIEGIKVQYPLFSRRLREAKSPQDKAEICAILKCLSKERENLQNIYDRCMEVLK